MQAGGGDGSGVPYEQLLQRQRTQLQDAYLKGVRRLRWNAERLAAERERRLRELLGYAADRSPFWQARLAGRDLATFAESDLPSLPILTRAEMMGEFDRLVTVPGLTLARVREHLELLNGDRYLDDQYRAIVTSGYTGTEAVHVYGWDAFVTFVMQGSRWTGRRGEDPDAVLAQIFSCSARHESGAFHDFSTFESGGPPSHCFSGTLSLSDLVTGLNEADPKVRALQGWPSVVRPLAMEALAGRLRIAPTWVSVAGEVCTPPVRDAVRAAWGIEPSEFWGCSEGTYAFPCEVGQGLHVSDDLVILEPVDRQGNVVPFGQPADRVLLTNLYNLDQPLIRYDLSDALTITDLPCPCGCAHRRILDIQGRIDGAFLYDGGAVVPRARLEQALLASPGLVDFFVVQTVRGVDLSIVTDGSCDMERLRRDVVDLLRSSGVQEPEISEREVGGLERLWSGKTRQFEPLPRLT
jgi:phenylacetate-CoA ligase